MAAMSLETDFPKGRGVPVTDTQAFDIQSVLARTIVRGDL